VVDPIDGTRAFLDNRPDPVHGTLIAAGKGRHRALIETMRDRRNDFA
jgi:fructose-1,6-bisphosphatase/inositol monophosphatase family enzyme